VLKKEHVSGGEEAKKLKGNGSRVLNKNGVNISWCV